MPSTLSQPLHVAIIMDGNGRWAQARGQERALGHRAGAAAVRRVVEAALKAGIATLTLYAFSSDNWRRPRQEVDNLMTLLALYLERERTRMVQHRIRCVVIGRRDRLPAALAAAIAVTEAATEAATQLGRALTLRLAIDYSGRTEIARAAAGTAARWAPGVRPSTELTERLMASALQQDSGPVDLLIRTGGERRLSDFLLWESACAELLFTRVMWPQFRACHLRRALAEFARRQRRFGAAPDPPVAVAASHSELGAPQPQAAAAPAGTCAAAPIAGEARERTRPAIFQQVLRPSPRSARCAP